MSVAIVAVLETVKLVKNPVIAVRIEEKRLDEVALENVALVDARVVIVADAEVSSEIVVVARSVNPETESLVIVVVARVEVPATTKLPEEVALPCPSTVKLKFSVQFEPFQYRVDVVAVPSAISP